ncbi:MAG: phosphoribosyl-AMP cyclohydrolase [Desulfosalsimonas sp.]
MSRKFIDADGIVFYYFMFIRFLYRFAGGVIAGIVVCILFILKAGADIMVELDFEKGGGLLPAIVQDYETGQVLMLAYMNRDAWQNTLKTNKATYYSRSRDKLWVKGETSGHIQKVKEVRFDCDSDTILLKVEQLGGAACHKGYKSCFYRKVEGDNAVVTEQKIFDPEEVYKK